MLFSLEVVLRSFKLIFGRISFRVRALQNVWWRLFERGPRCSAFFVSHDEINYHSDYQEKYDPHNVDS